MKSVALGKVCKIQNGYAFKSSEFLNSGIPLLRISSFDGGDVFLNERTVYVAAEFLNSKKDFIVEKGDVLIALSGATTGKYGIYNFDYPSLLNQRVGLLKNGLSKELDSQYFYFYLSVLKERILRKAGGAAQPNISTKSIGELKIPLPPLPTQKKIAAILDEADKLRRLNQSLIEKYDALAQALFLDMFGDPVRNPKGWEVVNIEDIASIITKGSSPKWQGYGYIETGVRFVTSENVRLGYLDITKDKFVAKEFHEKLGRSQLKENDILVNLVGASIGRGAIVEKAHIPANINQAVAKIQPIESLVHPRFLLALMITNSIQEKLIGNKVEGARANISLKNVREFKVISPPLTLQNEFKDRLKTIKEQKAQAQNALSKSDDLFNSLLQRAFKGELV